MVCQNIFPTQLPPVVSVTTLRLRHVQIWNRRFLIFVFEFFFFFFWTPGSPNLSETIFSHTRLNTVWNKCVCVCVNRSMSDAAAGSVSWCWCWCQTDVSLHSLWTPRAAVASVSPFTTSYRTFGWKYQLGSGCFIDVESFYQFWVLVRQSSAAWRSLLRWIRTRAFV